MRRAVGTDGESATRGVPVRHFDGRSGPFGGVWQEAYFRRWGYEERFPVASYDSCSWASCFEFSLAPQKT